MASQDSVATTTEEKKRTTGAGGIPVEENTKFGAKVGMLGANPGHPQIPTKEKHYGDSNRRESDTD